VAISVRIVTPQAIAFEGDAQRVEAPGHEGEIGVLPGHLPYLTLSRPGRLSVTETDGTQTDFIVGAGFAEAGPERVTVLTDLCEAVGSYPSDQAQADLAQAAAALAQAAQGTAAWDTAERNAFLARARLSR
jgi:F-type H+-transporting ATPase subunit epsilon